MMIFQEKEPVPPQNVSQCSFQQLQQLLKLLDMEGFDIGSTTAAKSYVKAELDRRVNQITNPQERAQLIAQWCEEVRKMTDIPDLDITINIEPRSSDKNMNHIDWLMFWQINFHIYDSYRQYEPFRTRCKDLLMQKARLYNLSYCGGRVEANYLKEPEERALDEMLATSSIVLDAGQKEALKKFVMTFKNDCNNDHIYR